MERCKLTLAAELLMKASHDLQTARTDADYATVILVAGAIYKVLEPLLITNCLSPRHARISEGAGRIHEALQKPFDDEQDRKDFEKRIYQRQSSTYNSLKHAGKPNAPATALDDLIVHGNLEIEARFLFEDAVYDFELLTSRCSLPKTFREPTGFYEFLSSDALREPDQTLPS